MSKGYLEELKINQKIKGESKVNISICKRWYFKWTDLDELRSKFDNIIPVFHICKSVSDRNIFTQWYKGLYKG